MHHHAVVIGASIGGLAAARVLSDHFTSVTVLDRDVIPPGTNPRKGVPQGRQAHALLAGGARAIAALYPGIMEEMMAAGAGILDFNDGIWFQAGGYRARNLVERPVLSASRPFIETHIRRRTAALPNVTVETGVAVDGLVHERDRVSSVRVRRNGEPGVVGADLVVDCSGRASRAPQWLAAMGYPEPEVQDVHCDVRYGTIRLRRRPTDLDGTFAVVIGTPPYDKRAGFMIPIEDDAWIVTIAASFGAAAPTDLESFRTIAASLPSPEIGQVLARAEPITEVANHRLASSRRRRYEKVKQFPAGFLALGDAICSFNPIYGQGMSSAVLQAVALGEVLPDHENDDRLVRAFYKRAAKVIDNPWKIAVGADFAFPECTGPKPAGTDLVNRYLKRVLLAAQVSPEVNTTLIMVQNLVESPTALMRPSFVRKALRAAREAERQLAGATGGHRASATRRAA
jgi:2-polyprenyl-6-methoxyphenol hydroxylase-like FAD-dependent oxidoreductase